MADEQNPTCLGIPDHAMKYVIIIEEGNDGSYSAYMPGCTSCGDALDELRSKIREAIDAHITLLREFGDPVPEPTSHAKLVDAL